MPKSMAILRAHACLVEVEVKMRWRFQVLREGKTWLAATEATGAHCPPPPAIGAIGGAPIGTVNQPIVSLHY